MGWGGQKSKKKKEKADLKDLFLSTPRMHDIFNLFIWVKQSFQGGKPTRRDKAELCLASPPSNPCLLWRLRALAQIYSAVIGFVSWMVGGWGVVVVEGDGIRVMHHFLPFVCFAFLLIDWLLPWTWVLWWRISGQKHKWQLLRRRHHKTWSISAPSLSIHSSIHFFHWGSILGGEKKPAVKSAKTVRLSHTMPQ